MTSGTNHMAATGFDLAVPSGLLDAHRFGHLTGSLTLCVHGISGNSRIFDFPGERLAGAHHRLVAFDLRGRGKSAITPPGSNGWERHARDVLAAAALGEDQFDLIGYSMGAYVAMEAALLAP